MGAKVVPFMEKLKLIEEETRNCSSIIHTDMREFDVTEGKINFLVRLDEKSSDY